MGTIKRGRPPTYDLYAKDSRQPPEKKAVYIVEQPDKQEYVGKATDVKDRTSQHRRSKKFPEGSKIKCMIADGRATSRTLGIVEQRLISERKPTLNKSKGGEGRPAVKKRKRKT